MMKKRKMMLDLLKKIDVTQIKNNSENECLTTF